MKQRPFKQAISVKKRYLKHFSALKALILVEYRTVMVAGSNIYINNSIIKEVMC